ncbi:MAG: IclR family transcriptional regulator [Bacillota bacterium]|nr:IclR family transcriptional regulator [Bacillota bacterium]
MRAVERTFRILLALGEAGGEGVRLRELARRVRLPEPTLLRFLESLVEVGAVEERGEGGYALGLLLRRLAQDAVPDLRAAAVPVMRALSERLHEDVHLATLDADSVLCLESVKSSHLLGVAIGTGSRVPIYASAMGKAILAFMGRQQRAELLRRVELKPLTPRTLHERGRLLAELAQTRRRGYALDNGELELGILCIAAPLFGPGGAVVGSISVTAPAERWSAAELERSAPVLLAGVAEVNRRLAGEGQSKVSLDRG